MGRLVLKLSKLGERFSDKINIDRVIETDIRFET